MKIKTYAPPSTSFSVQVFRVDANSVSLAAKSHLNGNRWLFIIPSVGPCASSAGRPIVLSYDYKISRKSEPHQMIKVYNCYTTWWAAPNLRPWVTTTRHSTWTMPLKNGPSKLAAWETLPLYSNRNLVF